MPLDGESDKPPFNPGHKPRIGLSFLKRQPFAMISTQISLRDFFKKMSFDGETNKPSPILAISNKLFSVSSLTKMFHLERVINNLSQIKRLALANISNKISLQDFFQEIPFDGESDITPPRSWP